MSKKLNFPISFSDVKTVFRSCKTFLKSTKNWSGFHMVTQSLLSIVLWGKWFCVNKPPKPFKTSRQQNDSERGKALYRLRIEIQLTEKKKDAFKEKIVNQSIILNEDFTHQRI